MEKLDVLAEGRRVGAAELTEEGLYLRFTVDCEDVTSGPCRLVGVGDRGELRLGVPEPEGGRLRLSRALSRRDCDVFLRRYYFAEPLADIARRYGLPLGTVKASLFRTREKLQKYLEKEELL